MVDQTLPALSYINEVYRTVRSIQLATYSLYGTTLSVAEFDAQIESEAERLDVALKNLSVVSQANLSALRAEWQKFQSAVRSERDIMAASSVDWDGARTALASLKTHAVAIEGQIKQIDSRTRSDAEENSSQMLSAMSTSTTVMVGSPFLFALVSVAAVFVSRNTIVLPI